MLYSTRFRVQLLYTTTRSASRARDSYVVRPISAPENRSYLCFACMSLFCRRSPYYLISRDGFGGAQNEKIVAVFTTHRACFTLALQKRRVFCGPPSDFPIGVALKTRPKWSRNGDKMRRFCSSERFSNRSRSRTRQPTLSYPPPPPGWGQGRGRGRGQGRGRGLYK